MIQRIQSLYLGMVCMTICVFLRASLWVKEGVGGVFTMKSYGLIDATGQCMIYPYGLPALLACFLILTAVYAIIRHDNRTLQLRLIAGMGVALVLLMGLILLLVKKVDATHLLDGHSSYKIGSILPLIALVANVWAAYHIKQDEQLVNADRFR